MDKKLLLIAVVVLVVFCVIALIVLFVGVPMLFYLGIFSPSIPRQCTISPGLSCIAYKLHAGTSELDFRLGQGTGHTIKITDVQCTQGSPDYVNVNGYSSNPVTINSGGAAYIAGSGSSHVVRCTDEAGNPPSHMTAGTAYTGKLYLKYTEVDTGITRTTDAIFSTTYEA
jgi:hypothetical protein